MNIDKIDRKILSCLQHDGRTTASKIADELDLTVPTITERMRKMSESLIIKGFQAIIDPRKIGLDVSAFISVITSSSSRYKEIKKYASETPEIIQSFTTTGAGSYLFWVVTKDSTSLEEILRKIQSWPNVTRTNTQMILSTHKSRQEVPL